MTEQTKSNVRAAVFTSIESAERAVAALRAAGFADGKVSVVCADCDASAPVTEPAGAAAPRTAAVGGLLGGITGGVATLTGVVTTGGFGVLAVGPLLMGLLGGAASGTFIGAMMSRGLEKEAADFFDQALGEGHVLVAVDVGDDEDDAEVADRVFRATGVDPLPLTQA